MSDAETKRRELATLRARADQLEADLASDAAVEPFQPTGFYTGYYATAGFVLGIFGAMASLLFNIVGSLLVGQDALRLVRVYLTFPLGDAPLSEGFDNNLALAIGCCLYLATGMLLGMVIHVALAYWTPQGSLGQRLALASVVAIVIWIVNFYVLLSWLQPLLVDMSPENYIVNQVPWWVAALTHLVFGWTMAVLYPLGQFVPYRRPTEQP